MAGLREVLRKDQGPAMPEGGRMLLVFFHERELLPDGGGFCLCWEADDAIGEYIHDCGGSREPFALKDLPVDYDVAAVGAPGVYVARLRFVDDGPGDWPGSREVLLQLHDMRRATAEEWKAHLDGEWPWPERYA
jgi:hypothetical protein